MAASSTPRIQTFTASEDLSSKKYTFVKFGSTADKVASCGANERAIGILMNAPESGGKAEVALPGGGAKLKISEIVALGKILTSTAEGLGEVADAANEWVSAIAHDAGVANDIIPVEVVQFQATTSDA